MKFDEVYRLLYDHQESISLRMVLLSQDTLREIYDCIVANRMRDCLELGTGFGATACVMAAAVEEVGGGTVTTIDHLPRVPVGVAELAELTGMTRYLRAVVHPRGYDWFLLQLLRQRNGHEPCFDLCYLDGAHEWEPDALAALLVPRLLRPGAWLMLDDLNYHFRGTETEAGSPRAGWSDEELDLAHVGLVFDLLVRTHPDLGHFALSNAGHIGWARKAGGAPPQWWPSGQFVGAVSGTWTAAFDGAPLTHDVPRNDGLSIEEQGSGVTIRSTMTDPNFVLRNPVEPLRPIDFVTLRLRLVAPEIETVQIFWISEEEENFHEERSMRCTVRASSGVQDLTFHFRGSPRARTIRLLRLDPLDGEGVVLLERVTFGGW